MCSVVVQIGQCGNQIGQQFWNQIVKDFRERQSLSYVHGDGKLRSINIDSEPKVIKRMCREFKTNLLREENVKIGRRGRGTNWALGYHGTKHHSEDVILEESMEAIRKEIERCPNFMGVIIIHSLSGGTGSGLGSHITELLRDAYPLAYIMSCVVAPHTSGESPLQHYNSLLCLAWLQRYSDCIVLYNNDEVLARLEKQSRRDPDKPISFTNMNKHIASGIAGLLLPTDTLKSNSGMSIGLEPWELVRSLCPLPSHKFLHVNHLSKSKLTWEQLAGSLLHNIEKHDCNGKPYHSLANLVVARGDSTNSLRYAQATIETRIKTAYHTVPWNPYPVDFWSCLSNTIGAKDSVAMTMASNYSHVTTSINDVIDKATLKFTANAYLHWYTKYGCEKDTFQDAFHTLHTVVKDYQEAVT